MLAVLVNHMQGVAKKQDSELHDKTTHNVGLRRGLLTDVSGAVWNLPRVAYVIIVLHNTKCHRLRTSLFTRWQK